MDIEKKKIFEAKDNTVWGLSTFCEETIFMRLYDNDNSNTVEGDCQCSKPFAKCEHVMKLLCYLQGLVKSHKMHAEFDSRDKKAMS